jgi:hypothetical protein
MVLMLDARDVERLRGAAAAPVAPGAPIPNLAPLALDDGQDVFGEDRFPENRSGLQRGPVHVGAGDDDDRTGLPRRHPLHPRPRRVIRPPAFQPERDTAEIGRVHSRTKTD